MKNETVKITGMDIIKNIDSTDMSHQFYGLHKVTEPMDIEWMWSNKYGFIVCDNRKTGKQYIGHGKKTMETFLNRWDKEWKKNREDRMIVETDIPGMEESVDLSNVPESIRLVEHKNYFDWFGSCIKYLNGGKCSGPSLTDMFNKIVQLSERKEIQNYH